MLVYSCVLKRVAPAAGPVGSFLGKAKWLAIKRLACIAIHRSGRIALTVMSGSLGCDERLCGDISLSRSLTLCP